MTDEAKRWELGSMKCRMPMVDYAAEFSHGGDCFHVLRIIANQQITAAKGAELLREILSGKKPDLPPFESGGPMLPESMRE